MRIILKLEKNLNNLIIYMNYDYSNVKKKIEKLDCLATYWLSVEMSFYIINSNSTSLLHRKISLTFDSYLFLSRTLI